MSDNKIEWTNKTWNPVTGCTKISAGCKNCYAERMAKRLAGRAGYPESPNQFKVTLHPDRLEQPLKWKKSRLIFVCSMSDLFHDDVPGSFIDKIFAVMAASKQHTFQILTKRPETLVQWYRWTDYFGGGDYLPNVWLGTSVENQEQADKRIPELLKVPAKVHFLSCEPLLENIELELSGRNYGINFDTWSARIDWVIVGGESGPGARPIDPEWVRSIKRQCEDSSVPFFFKQWGGANKKKKGRELDGRVWAEMPTVNLTTNE